MIVKEVQAERSRAYVAVREKGARESVRSFEYLDWTVRWIGRIGRGGEGAAAWGEQERVLSPLQGKSELAKGLNSWGG